MDNVLVNFQSGIDRISKEDLIKYEGRLDDVPGIFSLMDPVEGAIEAYHKLSEFFDIHILSTAPWDNLSAWSDKPQWVQKYLGTVAYKKLTLTHHKNIAQGDYLIDDRTKNGAGEFTGEHIHFLTEKFPDWESVLNYLLNGLI